MRKLDGLAAALALAGLVAIAAYFVREPEVVAGSAHVVDGDSIRLDGQDIRIAGIDAPALRQTCLVDGRSCACGDIARKALEAMLAGRHVTCRISRRNRYGRRVASCETGGEDIGAALVRSGYAVAYGRYESEDAEARREGLAIWAGSFERPSEWRRTHSDRGRS